MKRSVQEKSKCKPSRYPVKIFLALTISFICMWGFLQVLPSGELLGECTQSQPFSTTTWYDQPLSMFHTAIESSTVDRLALIAQVEMTPPQSPKAYFSPDSHVLALADLQSHPDGYPYYLPETALWKFGTSPNCFLQMAASFVGFTSDSQHVNVFRLIPCDDQGDWQCAAYIRVENGATALQWHNNYFRVRESNERKRQLLNHNVSNDLTVFAQDNRFFILNRTGSEIASFTLRGPINTVSFSPDGTWIAVAYGVLCENCSMPYGYIDLWGIPESTWISRKTFVESHSSGERRYEGVDVDW